MSILKKTFAVLTSCAMMLSLAACSAEPKESLVEKPEDLSDRAIVLRTIWDWPLSCPMPSMTSWESRSFPDRPGSPAAPEGVTVNGQILFLYQSGAVYNRVLELQSTGEAMSEAEFLALSEQAGNLCAITSIQADTLARMPWPTAPDLKTTS